eukprot:Partr_v1_DN24575_c0_g1_i7_m19921 putative vacuolar protein sorting 25 homolog (S. cerevisiae)
MKGKLSAEMLNELLDHLVASSKAAWEKKHQRCFIYWKDPSVWAESVLAWAANSALNSGSICTVYELLHGDSTRRQDFHGMDGDVFLRVLLILESRRKVQLLRQSLDTPPDEIGVKFL